MPRRVAAPDSSILIDLERGSLDAAAFALPLGFRVPDLLCRRESQPRGGGRLLAMGLKALGLGGAGAARAARYRRTVPALSLSDAFALALAHRTGGVLPCGTQPMPFSRASLEIVLSLSMRPVGDGAQGRHRRTVRALP